MVSAIIVAAGSSKRMGFDKLNAPLGSSTVLSRSIQAFLDCTEVDEVICVCTKKRFATLQIRTSCKTLKRVDGGAERHLSVANGLNAIDQQTQFVAVHDGARPLITPQQIRLCLTTAKAEKAASCARRMTETLKRADENDASLESISRENAWVMETPQCFERKLLDEAYLKLIRENILVTDEVSAVELLGIQTKLVHNPLPNPKITFAEDLKLAEHLIPFVEKAENSK